MDASLTGRFVELVVADYESEAVAGHVGDALYDFIACSAAGHESVKAWFGAEGGGSSVVGSRDRAPAEQAAAVNAAAAQFLDRDDLHWPSLTHPGSIVWPAVLAVGEECLSDFTIVERAAAIGYEVTARLATALGPSLRSYWHPTTTAGTIGAAVGAALVFSPDDPEVAVSAAGHAVSVAATMIQVLLEHSPTGAFDRAHAARTSVAAARASLAGMPGMQWGLEGGNGFFAAVAPDANPDDLLTPPADWALATLTNRPYATTGYAQTAVEAARQLAPVEAANVQAVDIVAPAGAAAIAGNTSPGAPIERWWSVPYAVAVTLVAGDPSGLEEPGWANDNRVLELLSRTTVAARSGGSSGDISTEITLVGQTGGATAAASVHAGHPEQPLDDERLVAKWVAMQPVVTPARAAAVLALCRENSDRTVPELVADINNVILEDQEDIQ